MNTSSLRLCQIGRIVAGFRRFIMRLATGITLIATASLAQAQTTFNFTLARTAHTSAGVYNSSGKLVSTLWSDALWTSTGPFTCVWDNLDDWGNPAPADTYTIKVMAHNANYVWEGVAGNTSDNNSGATVHACLNFTTTISFSGETGCYSVGYSENSPCFYSFNTATPQQLIARFTGCKTGGNDYGWYFSDADSSQVYFACPATQLTGTTLLTQPGAVCKFNPTTGTSVAFTSGTTVYEKYHPFANGVLIGTQPSITGLAVQKNGGSLVAVSVAADNLIYLLDKTSGSVVRSFSVTAPKALAMDNSDNLWVISGSAVYQYSNLSSTPILTGTASTGLVTPIALAVSPATASQPNLLLVTDGGTSQQIKAFNMSGVAQWTFGQANGYTNDPTVTTDKFWFYNPEASCEQAAIAFQPDGTFWVVDCMNDRMLHYQLGATAGVSPTYQNQVAFINRFYTNAVDQNNSTRIFACTEGKWLEFKIDYSKALSGTNGSWTLVKNWSHASPIVSGTSYTGFTIEGFKSVSTLSNGRTYALAYNRTSGKHSVLELSGSGQLRVTGVETTSAFINPNGSLRYMSRTNNVSTYNQQTLTGFDASYNPIWSGTTTIATVPSVTGTDPWSENNSGGPRFPVTTSNKLIIFDNSKAAGMHLGGIDLAASTQWAWQASPALGAGYTTDPQVPFFGDGTYDNFASITNGGALHDVNGRNIVYGYKGEFWNASEANQLMHFYDNGLFVGQFGTPGSAATGATIPAGAAGNMMMGTLVVNGGKLYYYTNDENQHGGMHRWRLDGLNTIAELAGSGTLNSSITLTGTAPAGNDPSKSGIPGGITGLQAAQSNGCNFLQWTGTNAVYYQVRRSTTSNNGYQIIATGLFQNCFTDLNVTNGTTYYYAVTPVNQNGNGGTTRQTVATPNTVGNVYEAELGTLSGVSARSNKTASGNAEVANTNTGSVTINNINGGLTSGTCALVIRYRWNYGTWTTATLTVNGTAVTLPAFPQTPSDASWANYSVNIPLNSGTNNTLVFSKGPMIDKFTVMADMPFKGTPWIIPDTGSIKIEVENYDMGGEGKAFHNGSSTEQSGYRAPDSVEVSYNTAASNGYHIGYCNANEWLKYTVSVPTTGAYTFTIYAGSPNTGSTLHVEDELGNNLTGTMTITNTGNYNTFGPNSVTVNLAAGTHTLKLVENSGGYNLDYFTLSH